MFFNDGSSHERARNFVLEMKDKHVSSTVPAPQTPLLSNPEIDMQRIDPFTP